MRSSIEDVTPRRQYASRYRKVAHLVAALGVLAGLLGMHLLGLHGVQQDPAVAMAASNTESLAAEHSSMPRAAHDESISTSHGETPSFASECCRGGHGMGAMMLCLALLIGSVAGALMLTRRAADRTLHALRPFVLGALTPSWRARAGPPYTMAFSVIRC